MQSKATSVAAYMLEVPRERAACLKAIRKLCRELLAGYSEVMKYGMPCYSKDGQIEVSFGSQKNYIALYILKTDVVEANREALAGLSVGKGCIRYSRPEQVNLDVVRKLLAGTVASSGKIC